MRQSVLVIPGEVTAPARVLPALTAEPNPPNAVKSIVGSTTYSFALSPGKPGSTALCRKYSDAMAMSTHSAGAALPGSALYVGRVGALAVALGVDRYPGANRVRTFAAASRPAWMAPS